MMIDTKVHTSNKNIKRQFDDLDYVNRKERFNYGIISDIDTSLPNSPLSINIQRYIFTISVSYDNVNIYSEDFHTKSRQDCLVVTTINEDGYSERGYYYAFESYTKGSATYSWQHYEAPEQTVASISNFINNMFGSDMISKVENGAITITTFSNKSHLNVINKSETIFYSFDTKLVLRKGSVVFKDGNSLTLDDDADFDFTKPSNSSKDETFRVCIRYKMVPTEYGTDLFGDTAVKRNDFDTLDNCIVIEPNTGEELADDTICIAVIKIIEGVVCLVDVGGHTYTYNRPWFTSKDDYHRSQLGTSEITKHNPHGIGYNDIDNENTLHNRLLDNGIIISPPSAIQGCPGILVDEVLYAENAVIDIDKQKKYRKLTYAPNQILGVFEINGDSENELAFKYIKNTNYIEINESGLTPDALPKRNIRVVYLATTSGSSDIEFSQGIRINKIQNGDVIFSNGKNLNELSEYIDLYHKNINGYYIVGINNKGKIESNPTVKVNKQLDVDSDTIESVDSRSRVKLYLYNTDAKYPLKCPDSGVVFEADEEFNIAKTHASYYNNANGKKVFDDESYTSPEYNTYIEVDEEALISGGVLDGQKKKDYIHLLPSKGTTDGVSVQKKTFVIDTIGKVTPNNPKFVDLAVDGLNKKLLSISWYMEYKFSSDSAYDSKIMLDWICNGSTTLLGASIYNVSGSIYAIQGTKTFTTGLPNDIFTNEHKFKVSLDSNGTDVVVTRLKIELTYNELNFRYYITQEEDGKQVTRLLYDPYTDYSHTGCVFHYADGSLYFKKEGLIYKTKGVRTVTDTVTSETWEQTGSHTETIYTPQNEQIESGIKYSVVEQKQHLESKTTSDIGDGSDVSETGVVTDVEVSSKTKLNAETLTIPDYGFVSHTDTVQKEEEYEVPINDACYPITQTLKTNAEFNVEISLYGEANGEAVTDTIVFDSSFREQEPYNYKLSGNAFDKLDKYTVNARSSSGNVLMLSYPISNYTNPCNINNTQFTDNNVITKFNDTRLCVAELDESIVSLVDVTEMLASSELVLTME